MVRLLHEPGEDFGLAREQLLFVAVSASQSLMSSRFRRQLGVRRNHAHRLLARERLLPDLVPTLVELALVLVRPLLGHVVRCVDGPGRVVDEEWLVRRHRLLRFDPVDRLVGHVRREVVPLRLRRRHARHTIVDQRIPLIRLASDEAVELVEALMGRPAVEGSGHARLPRRGLVPLAERTGAVAVQPKHLRQGRHAIRNGARVAGKRRRGLHDRTGVRLVMVAARLERHPRRRTERRRVEIVVSQPALRELVEGGCLQRTAKRARCAKAEVVDQDDHDVGCALGRCDLESRGRRDIARVQLGVGWRLGLQDRQRRPVDPSFGRAHLR